MDLDDILSSCLKDFTEDQSSVQDAILENNEFEQLDGQMIDDVLDEIAEKEMEIQSTKKNEYMEQKVENQIENANHMNDLMPYIELLLPITELKHILLNKYKATKQTHYSNVHKLYLKSACIDEILSHYLLLKIIKYLNYRDYPPIFVLSKQFNTLMRGSTSIYNSYTFQIFATNDLWKQNRIKMILNHKLKLLSIEAGCAEEEKTNRAALHPRHTRRMNNKYHLRPLLKKHANDIVRKINNIHQMKHNHYFFKWSSLKKLCIEYDGNPQSTQHTMNQLRQFMMSLVAFNANVAANHVQNTTAAANSTDTDDGNNIDEGEVMNVLLGQMYRSVLSLTINNICDVKLFRTYLDISRFPKLFHLCLVNHMDRRILCQYNFANLLSLELYHITKNREIQRNANKMDVINHTVGHLGQTNANELLNTLADAHNNDGMSDEDDVGAILNGIFRECHQLIAFRCISPGSAPNDVITVGAVFGMNHTIGASSSPHHHRNKKRTVIFPATMQYICLENCIHLFNVDLSKCEEVITLYLSGDNRLIGGHGANAFKVDTFMAQWPKILNCLVLQQAKSVYGTQAPVPKFVNSFYKYLKQEKPFHVRIRFVLYWTHPALSKSSVEEEETTNTAVTDPQQDAFRTLSQMMGVPLSQTPTDIETKLYNPVMDNKELRGVTVHQLMMWHQMETLQSVLELEGRYLVVMERRDDARGGAYDDLWEIFLKICNKSRYIQQYKEWFEMEISLWIKYMTKRTLK